jgi:hypothetical protein
MQAKTAERGEGMRDDLFLRKRWARDGAPIDDDVMILQGKGEETRGILPIVFEGAALGQVVPMPLASEAAHPLPPTRASGGQPAGISKHSLVQLGRAGCETAVVGVAVIDPTYGGCGRRVARRCYGV